MTRLSHAGGGGLSSLPLSLLPALAFFVSGLSAQDAVPHWIWKGEEPVVYLIHPFEAPADLSKATLVASGDDSFQLFVNGKRVARSDNWENPVIQILTGDLNKGGENVIAVRAENREGAAGFLAQLTLETPDGKTKLVTGEHWLALGKPEKGWNQAAFKPSSNATVPVTQLHALGGEPRGKIDAAFFASIENLKEPTATPVDAIKVPEGFQVELLYSVPKDRLGSWVAMTVDDKGRLIVSDQYGSLYRLPVPPSGETVSEGQIEKIDLDIGGAQGLLFAHGSLYVVLNTGEHGGRGLYRLRDTDGDDQYDDKQLLKKFQENGGEHGPHAVVLSPNGQSLYVICGNQTELPEYQTSLVPPVWEEDLLLPRIYGRGFMKGTLAPRGWIARTDLEGKEWTIVATGFRNQYDAAFNRHGELFTFDADMEWDMNTPWYRPTRVNHVISGAEFGWRNGSGKWPDYYSDSFGAVVDVGPGSPTGVCFGTGAKFPAKYQDAFYICDWSYGKLYAVHMQPDGASYTGEVEEFIAAQPLPLTDLLIHPEDGAMYFAIGGRRVQSGLYRVTYKGSEGVEPVSAPEGAKAAQMKLRALEAYHGSPNPAALDAAWPQLGSQDRALRYAARVAIEHQPVAGWQERALAEADPQAALAAMIALARQGDAALQPRAVAKLASFEYPELDQQQRLDLLRAYSLVFLRLGEPSEPQRKMVVSALDPHFPARTPEENIEFSQLFVYLQAPTAAEKIVGLLREAPSQEEQLAYGKNLRLLTEGWKPDLREAYFEWLLRAQTYRGGASFSKFIESIKVDAVASLPADAKQALQALIDAVPEKAVPQFTLTPRQFQKNWTVEDFDDVIAVGLEGGRDFANGRNMFGAASCFACHRFDQEGGAIGPDLTSVAGKFSPRDLLEAIVDPNKEISDQYGQMVFTKLDDSQVIGRIMNLSGDTVRVNTNMLDPNEIVTIDRKLVKSMKPSPISMMPPGLVNTLTKDDVLDLLAYLLAKGDPDDPMFQN